MRSDPVRLEISANADPAFTAMLTAAHDLESGDVYAVDGPVDLTALLALAAFFTKYNYGLLWLAPLLLNEAWLAAGGARVWAEGV